jgi:hypothetical protein
MLREHVKMSVAPCLTSTTTAVVGWRWDMCALWIDRGIAMAFMHGFKTVGDESDLGLT